MTLMKIPMSSPDLTDADRQAVIEVINTPNLSLGPKVVEFEKVFASIPARSTPSPSTPARRDCTCACAPPGLSPATW